MNFVTPKSQASVFLHRTLSLALTALTANPSLAEEQPVELNPLAIIANPITDENHLSPFSSMSSVVTADQLRDQNALDLASVLRRTPGIQISRFNPVGAFGGNEGGRVYSRNGIQPAGQLCARRSTPCNPVTLLLLMPGCCCGSSSLHLDTATGYINPVKHNHVARVVDWPYSTFHRDVAKGLYAANWGGAPGMLQLNIGGVE